MLRLARRFLRRATGIREASSHFSDGGGVWPVHCVAETNGAAFHPELALPGETAVVTMVNRAGR